MDSSKTVRFGLIGYGAWGSCHAKAIEKTEGAELVGIAARSEETCSVARNAYPDAGVVSDYRELIARDDIDIVDVVLPSHLHHEVGCAVLKAGKHLMMEKPMGLSVEECDDLIRLAKENDCILAIGHELRLSSLWGKVKEMIDDGFVGQPQYVLVELSRKPYRQGASGWRYDINRVGNWILEEPIHFFDLARWYLQGIGEPVSVFATANSRQPNHPELQDNFSAMVQFEEGAYAVVSQTLASFEHHQMVKVSGTKGSLWASWSGAMDRDDRPTFFLKAGDGETVQNIPITESAGELFELEAEIGMCVRAIRNGGAIATTGEDGLWSTALCIAAQESVDTGAPVKMSDVLGK
ncbi:MAG: Gfo/Idh/MocA family oxidoreductase [Verrucomicrobia bacterium]|nr:Gfo/Idh/MocA family oxidoreductase [Verrucomicrobiota bacterium]MDA1067105.1 Gfo/Idh/MocA family oxidoreductase [Verrucomicrobiota bacterium]